MRRHNLPTCGRRVQGINGLVQTKILNDALGNENECNHEAGRKKYPESGACNVDPEIAERLCADAGDAADESESDTDGGRDKVVIRKASHLGEVAHRRFRDVGLPVRVCGEADSGVPREGGRDACESVRIQQCGHKVLHAFNEVQGEQGDSAEKEHGEAVFLPVHFFFFVDAAEAIDHPLDRTTSRIEDRFFLGEHPGKKDTDGFRQQKNDKEEKKDLKDADGGHGQNFSGHKRAASR